MTQKEDRPSEKIENGTPPSKGDKLISFLNTKLGMLVIVTIVGILGLFTWQRWDWDYKQDYKQDFNSHQILVDRRIEVIEQANKDVGQFLANAETTIAAIEKRVPNEQRNEIINTYNVQQKQWFGSHHAHTALLEVYFPSNVSVKFTEIVTVTRELDGQISYLSKTDNESIPQAATNARQAVDKIGGMIREWNNLVKQELYKQRSQ